ncbi:MAG: prepilin peptidase [Deltaproteobacteria bacterium]|nr:prepilin peptidase [Deltaproteobacteria bacterium]
MQDFTIVCAALISITSLAALIDHRSGIIPNYLTYTALIAALIVHGIARGPAGFIESAMGAAISFFVPYLAFRARAMGGGDVKLFTALGAIAGPGIGLEIELVSLATIYLYGIVLVTTRGGLKQTVENSWRIALNLFLPRSRRKPVQTESLTSFRLGGAILFGTSACVVDHLWLSGWML